jgi:hypothetical protein
MTLQLAISVVIAFSVGFMAISLLWPRNEHAGWALFAFKIFAGLGLGQGITACLAFVYLVVHGRADRSYIFFELVFLLAMASLFALATRRKDAQTFRLHAARGGASPRYEWLLAVALCVAATAALVAVGIGMDRAPYGDWDAWGIYNLRARSIYRGGYDWRDSFSDLLHLTHPDYPLLLPLSVVRGWIYMGGESTVAPRLIGGVFMVATTGLVFSAIAALRGSAQACIAGIVLLGNVLLIRHASSQYADVPLMFFFAAAITFLILHDEAVREAGNGALAVAGLAAGLAAWTKNEGMLFLIVLMAVQFAVVARSRGLRAYAGQLRALAAGLLPVLAILIFFKSTLAPPNDLVTLSAGQSVWAKLVDSSRYSTIARELLQRAPLRDGSRIGMVYLLAIYGVGVGLGARRSAGVVQATLTLLLLSAGYLAVYLITPNDLQWHISTSMDRLLVQVWPTFVLVYFLLLATPEESFSLPRQSARTGGRDESG